MTYEVENAAEAKNALSEQEKIDLEKLESTIERGKIAFLIVGQALSRICQERLYRETHKSFQDYVLQRWGFARSQGYRLIQASELALKLKEVSPTGDSPPLPKTERALRALLKIKDAKDQLNLLTRAHQLNGNTDLSHSQIISLGRELGYVASKGHSTNKPDNALTAALIKLEESISSGAEPKVLLKITKKIRSLVRAWEHPSVTETGS
jgi:hypothetical protein